MTYKTQFIGTRSGDGAAAGEGLDVSESLQPVYRLRGGELYVRARVTSSMDHPNPSCAGQKESAWTQPVGWKKVISGEE